MTGYMGSEWSPSEWYRFQATPTQKKLIKLHVGGKHTKHCMVYDANYHGTYCKWLVDVFWPKIYFTKATDLAGEPSTEVKASSELEAKRKK